MDSVPSMATHSWPKSARKGLALWLKHLGVSNRELARRLTAAGESITPAAIGFLINGTTKAPLKPTQSQVADAMGIYVGDLDGGPNGQRTDPAQGFAQLRAAARAEPGAVSTWKAHRQACVARREWHGQPPNAVKAYTHALDAHTGRQVQLTLERAHVIALGCERLLQDATLSEATRQDARSMRDMVFSAVSTALDPQQGIDHKASSAERTQQWLDHHKEVADLMASIEEARIALEG